MVRLDLNGKKYMLPVSLQEIELATGMEIAELLEDNSNPSYEVKASMLSLLTKADMDVVTDIQDEDFVAIYDNLSYLHKPQDIYLSRVIKLGDRFFETLDLDRVDVRTYMEIERMLDVEDKYDKTINTLCIMLREVDASLVNKTHEDIFNKKEGTSQKRYEEKDDANSALFLDSLDFGTASVLISRLMVWLDALHKSFPKLFVPIREQEEKDKFDELEEKEERSQEEKTFDQIWGLYGVLHDISESRMEFDYWLDKDIRELFVELTYRKGLNQQIKNKQRDGRH